MFTPEDNELLCRVEGDAAMGRLMRQHWVPACMSQELPVPGGDPIRVRLLGENLVAFRDSTGRVGMLEEACRHRSASLFYARNEDGGLRCLYHGWKMNVSGEILEMPSEPPDSRATKIMKQKAYPVKEAGGLIWTYLGDPQQVPDFEPPAFAVGSNAKISIAKVVVRANWAQVVEGGIDSSHSSNLHSDEMRGASGVEGSSISRTEHHGLSNAFTVKRPSVDKAPRLKVETTNYGLRYVALRRPLTDPDTQEYARITVYVAPFTLLIPPNSSFSMAQYITPIDDHNTVFHFVAWGDDSVLGDGIDQDVWRKRAGATVGVDVDQNYRNLRTLENRHMQDREAMKKGSFSGIQGTGNQDIAMWESMGSISNRSKEGLVSGDLAVAQFRRLMVKAAREVEAGRPAIGTTAPHAVYAEIRAFEGLIPKTQDWRALGVGPVPALHPDKAQRRAA